MEETKNPLVKSALQYGLYLGLAIVVLDAIQYLLDLYASTLFSFIGSIIATIAIVLIIRNYRDEKLNGDMKFGQGVAIGTLSGFFAGFIISAFMLILIKFVEPNYIEKFLAQLEETYLNYGMKESQIDQIMEDQQENMSEWSFIYNPIIAYSVGCLIISLIASAVMRKKENNSFEKDTI